jgi:hypothetical protein
MIWIYVFHLNCKQTKTTCMCLSLNSALLSRCRVVVLNKLSPESVRRILVRFYPYIVGFSQKARSFYRHEFVHLCKSLPFLESSKQKVIPLIGKSIVFEKCICSKKWERRKKFERRFNRRRSCRISVDHLWRGRSNSAKLLGNCSVETWSRIHNR